MTEEGDDRGWYGWMTSLTQWTWVWAMPRDGEGQGSLQCCRPWAGIQTWQSDWTTTLSQYSLCTLKTEEPQTPYAQHGSLALSNGSSSSALNLMEVSTTNSPHRAFTCKHLPSQYVQFTLTKEGKHWLLHNPRPYNSHIFPLSQSRVVI